MQKIERPRETMISPIEQALLLELERDRIAVGELLQADTAQVLTGVLVALASAVSSENPKALREQVNELRPVVRDALERVQNLAARVRSSLLRDFGLDAAVRDLVSAFNGPAMPEIHLAMTAPDARLSMMERSLIFRILEEALKNAEDHAACSRIEISSRESAGELRYELRDNGVGFKAIDEGQTRGITLMKARARALGGRLEIRSRAGEGTSVLLRIAEDDQK
jgi:two-component system, NarL family, sensor histidine kinase DegS